MTQYISKDDIVAEIERRRDAALMRQHSLEAIGQETIVNEMVANELTKVLKFINTLEVKEVDLDEHQISDIIQNLFPTDQFIESETLLLDKEEAIIFAKHFFELGLKASNVLTWEDMKQIRDIMVECSAIGLWSKPDEEYYQEVVKRFKAQKGE